MSCDVSELFQTLLQEVHECERKVVAFYLLSFMHQVVDITRIWCALQAALILYWQCFMHKNSLILRSKHPVMHRAWYFFLVTRHVTASIVWYYTPLHQGNSNFALYMYTQCQQYGKRNLNNRFYLHRLLLLHNAFRFIFC